MWAKQDHVVNERTGCAVMTQMLTNEGMLQSCHHQAPCFVYKSRRMTMSSKASNIFSTEGHSTQIRPLSLGSIISISFSSRHAYRETLPTVLALMPDERVPPGSQGSSPTGTNSSLKSADRFGLDANDTGKILVYEYRRGPVKTSSQKALCSKLDEGSTCINCAASESLVTSG
jgi:hypothetical protein